MIQIWLRGHWYASPTSTRRVPRGVMGSQAHFGDGCKKGRVQGGKESTEEANGTISFFFIHLLNKCLLGACSVGDIVLEYRKEYPDVQGESTIGTLSSRVQSCMLMSMFWASASFSLIVPTHGPRSRLILFPPRHPFLSL